MTDTELHALAEGILHRRLSDPDAEDVAKWALQLESRQDDQMKRADEFATSLKNADCVALATKEHVIYWHGRAEQAEAALTIAQQNVVELSNRNRILDEAYSGAAHAMFMAEAERDELRAAIVGTEKAQTLSHQIIRDNAVCHRQDSDIVDRCEAELAEWKQREYAAQKAGLELLQQRDAAKAELAALRAGFSEVERYEGTFVTVDGYQPAPGAWVKWSDIAKLLETK